MADPVSAVRSAFPGRRVELVGAGQLNWAVQVDGELIVRVPRHEYGIDRLQFEVDVLSAIAEGFTVATPDIVEVALHLPVGQAFVAHRLIPGRVLQPSDVETLHPDVIDHIGRQVGHFLGQLHAIELRRVPAVPVLTASEFASQLKGEVEDRLASRVSPQQLDALFMDLAELDALPDHPTVLAHTDLGGNIIADETGNVGVIDFGSCFATHPALDVASLSVLGDPIVQAAAAEYALLGTLAQEAKAVARTFFLQDVLYGARQEDWTYVRGMFDPS